jgi:hypothetical protein
MDTWSIDLQRESTVADVRIDRMICELHGEPSLQLLQYLIVPFARVPASALAEQPGEFRPQGAAL